MKKITIESVRKDLLRDDMEAKKPGGYPCSCCENTRFVLAEYERLLGMWNAVMSSLPSPNMETNNDDLFCSDNEEVKQNGAPR